MAKLTISLPDDVAKDLDDLAGEDVGAFVVTAVRNEVDRVHLIATGDEIPGDLGTVDPDEVKSLLQALRD